MSVDPKLSPGSYKSGKFPLTRNRSLAYLISLDTASSESACASVGPISLHIHLLLTGVPIDCQPFLHWGLSWKDEQKWDKPPEKYLDSRRDTLLRDAAETPFVHGSAALDLVAKQSGLDWTADAPDNLCSSITFPVQHDLGECLPELMLFVLHCKGSNEWIKDGAKDFRIPVKGFLQDALFSEELRLYVDEKVKVRQGEHDSHSCWTVKNSSRDFHLESLSFGSSAGLDLEMYCDTSAKLILHWGEVTDRQGSWRAPFIGKNAASKPDFVCHPWDDKAVQTCFEFCSTSGRSALQWLRLHFSGDAVPKAIKFVLKEQQTNRWYSDNDKQDFYLELPCHPEWAPLRAKREQDAATIARIQEEERVKREALWTAALKQFKETRESRRAQSDVLFKSFTLSGSHGDLDVSAFTTEDKHTMHVLFTGCFRTPTVLHWGVAHDAGERGRRKGGSDWTCPPEKYRPRDTVVVDAVRSCDTPFSADSSSGGFLQTLEIIVPSTPCPKTNEDDPGVCPELRGLICVLRDDVGWYKQTNNTDIEIRLMGSVVSQWREDHSDLVEQIVQAEVEWNHMTLMHRYNLMNDLMGAWDEGRPEELRTPASDLKTVAEWNSLFTAEDVRTFPADSAITRSVIFPPQSREESDREFWAWLYVWGRFAYMGLLDWQRNYNTKPRELAASTETVTHKVAGLWKNNPKYRPLIRLLLSTMSRGGNQGQAIRDRILDIMHKHKIPEHGANFYEQWHQKLHNNTTPDDVGICKAVIRFLQSGGDVSEYWRVLGEHCITRERLASYERKITTEPYMVGYGGLVQDLYDYLSILQDVHDALNLKKAFGHARRFLPGELQKDLESVVQRAGDDTGLKLRRHSFHGPNITEHEAHHKFLSLAYIRRRLVFEMNRTSAGSDAIRELLFLDFALEQQQSLIIMGASNFSIHHLTAQLKDILVNFSGHDPTNGELHAICSDWWNLAEIAAFNKFGDSRESALLLKSLVDRVARVVGDMVDQWQVRFGGKSNYLGSQVGTDKKVLDVFVDETLRGSALFSISLCLKRIEPLLRTAAELPPWQMISVVPKVQGVLVVIDKLTNIQDKVFETPTILLSGAVSGEEEIPTGVQAVLVRSSAVSPDILSHVSVRARNAQVLLAVCFEADLAERLERELQDSWVQIQAAKDGSGLTVEAAERPEMRPQLSRTLSGIFDRRITQEKLISDVPFIGKKAAKAEMNLRGTSKEWCVGSCAFSSKVVGSKSLNLGRLRPSLPDDVITPAAVALPYGCLQKTLLHGSNVSAILPKLEKCLKRLKEDTSNEDAAFVFRQVKEYITNLSPPDELFTALREEMGVEDQRRKEGAGTLVRLLDGRGQSACWAAITNVWASLFDLRPWVSLSKARRSYHELNMAVLVQQLLPASYAFVLHSRNPFSDETDEMYGELVAGLGETLVGNYPGRALGWTMPRGGEPKILAFPSKSVALRSSASLIFRSDSNGEDLEGFAGAGLFESVTADAPRRVRLRYHNAKLILDTKYRQSLLKAISELAFTAEDSFGEPQDIEGVVIGETQLAIVQSRPQV